jgi:polysaccharide biosynthesis/export protein
MACTLVYITHREIAAMQRRTLKALLNNVGVAAGVVMVLCMTGCATLFKSDTFRAASLPRELVAPKTLDLEAVDLAGLANNSVSVEVIQPGDVLDVSMVTDYAKLATTTTPIRVAADGSVSIPLVGAVAVGGLEIEQAEREINAQSIARGIFRSPSITVTMKQCRVRTVTVVGAVVKPGVQGLPRGSTSLLAALVAAGGLTKDAGAQVEIRHTDLRRSPVDRLPLAQQPRAADSVVAASHQTPLSGAPSPPTSTYSVDLLAAAAGDIVVPELSDGDVVHVRKRTLPPVHVIGLVQRPGEFPYPTDREIRVLDALALAGGVSNPAAERLIVIRQLQGAAKPSQIAVSLQNAKSGPDNITLAPGDTVTVEHTAATTVVEIFKTVFHVGFGISSNATMF